MRKVKKTSVMTVGASTEIRTEAPCEALIYEFISLPLLAKYKF
jgi:hypothetical protein